MKFRELIIESIMDPGVIHKELKTIVLRTSDLVQALFFISIASVVVTYISFWLPSVLFDRTLNELNLIATIVSKNPFIFVILQCAILLMISLIITFGGQFFSGAGTFNNALAGVLWINFILVGVNIFQILLIVSIPILADFVALLASLWSIWALVVFSKELHGFNSLVVTGMVGLILFSLTVLILGSLLTFFGFVIIEGV
ncbi:MAG: YIP1 family protein [Paracoccaceae bacterium]